MIALRVFLWGMAFVVVMGTLELIYRWPRIKCNLFHRRHWHVIDMISYSGLYLHKCDRCREIHVRRH